MTISDTEITFVVQGPIRKGDLSDPFSTFSVLGGIRKLFPGSNIVLSTWENQDIKGLSFDKLVTSKDPGAPLRTDGVYSNTNRMIVSTTAGLTEASTQFSAKLRTDNYLSGRSFLNFFGRYKDRLESFKVFKERIVISSLYCRNPRLYFHAFHPSDIFQFGLTSDLLKFWSVPLQKEPEYSFWFLNHPRPKPDQMPLLNIRYVPEQYVWIQSMRAHGYDVDVASPCDNRPEILKISDLSLVNNFVIVDPKHLSLNMPKQLGNHHPFTVYSFLDWKLLYYCGEKYGTLSVWWLAFRTLGILKRVGNKMLDLARWFRQFFTKKKAVRAAA